MVWVLLLLLAFGDGAKADVVILSDIPGKGKPFVSGETKQANKYFSPASTFKMIIALVAFEKGIATPYTRVLCSDAFLPKKPMDLTFQRAMYHSSNDFFMSLLDKIDGRELVKMAQRCGFGKPIGPMPRDKRAWRHGGNIRVTPMQEHLFMKNLAMGKLPLDRKIQTNLIRVLKWPSPKENLKLFGKTGSWERTYWFTGLAANPEGQDRVCTVTLTSFGSNRNKAIQRFMQQVERPIEEKD